jgi:hypothetical protein
MEKLGSQMTTSVTFEESLEDDDWGLIIGKDGTLKGMFIPEGDSEAEVPEAIIQICIKFFGVDPRDDTEVTLH